MQPSLISWILFCAVGLVFPCCLLVYGWRRNRTFTSPLIVPMIAVVVLALAMVPAMRSAILGGDYSRRLCITIDVFAVLVLINAIYRRHPKGLGNVAIGSVSRFPRLVLPRSRQFGRLTTAFLRQPVGPRRY